VTTESQTRSVRKEGVVNDWGRGELSKGLSPFGGGKKTSPFGRRKKVKTAQRGPFPGVPVWGGWMGKAIIARRGARSTRLSKRRERAVVRGREGETFGRKVSPF